MITWLCDDKYTGASRFIQAVNWDAAQDKCFEEDLILVGEYVSTEPGPDWLAPTVSGETIQ